MPDRRLSALTDLAAIVPANLSFYVLDTSEVALADKSKELPYPLFEAYTDARYLQDAPSNGSQYARIDGGWAVVTGGVASVFGRIGAVVAALNDYPASFITNTPAGGIASTDVQGALNELDTEKAAITSLDNVAFTGAYADLSGTPTLGTLAAFNDAPSNGSQYARLDGAWAVVSGGVTSFNTRTGAVVSASGDYTAAQVTNTPAGNIAATTVQAAIAELDSEKAGLALANTFTAQQTVSADLRARRLYLGDDGSTDNFNSYITDRPSSSTRRAFFFGVAQNAEFGLTVSPSDVDTQKNTVSYLWTRNFDGGAASTYFAGYELLGNTASGKLRIFNSQIGGLTVGDIEIGFGDGAGFSPAFFMQQSTRSFGFGTMVAPQALLHAVKTDAGTSAILNLLILGHNSDGTAATGFGVGLSFQGESSTTNSQNMARLTAEWATATHASRKARSKWTVYDTAEREAIRIEADGAAAMVGFLGAAAIARPATYTLASTAGRVLPTPEATFTGQDNAQAGSVYAKSADIITLQTRLNSVEGVLRQLIIDLASTSGYGLLVAS